MAYPDRKHLLYLLTLTLVLIIPFKIVNIHNNDNAFAQGTTPDNFIGVGLDPNNIGANPNPDTLSEFGLGLARVVYKEDQVTQAYIQQLIDSGITPILVMNWEANDSVWTDGNIDQDYLDNYSEMSSRAVEIYGDQVIYQGWNEPDGTAGTISLSPQQYASIQTTLFNAIKSADPNAIVITAGLVSGNPDYLRQVIEAMGGNLAADGVSVHPYVDPSQQTIDDVKNIILQLASISGKPVWMTEFGWETPDQQAQASWLLQVMNLVNDEDTKDVLQAVLWYAFSDTMKSGFGLFDVNGNPKLAFTYLLEFLENPLNSELLAELLEELFPPVALPSITITPSPSPTPTPPPLTCSAADAPPGPFRPAPCEDCGGAIRYPVNTCATSFTVSQDTHFYFVDKDTSQGYWDPEASEVILCDEDSPYAYFDRDWGGWITIDTDKTLVPFAGYHDKLENQEAKYLAQYFAGSLAGVGPKYSENTFEHDQEMQLESGVLTKVLTLENARELDDLRCQRIALAMADDNENYRIPFNDNSNLPDAKRLSEFNPAANRVPCFRPQVSYQQNPALWHQWDNDMVAWLQTDYAKLWPYIPLTTLKDAPGSLALTVQSAPGRLVNNFARLSFPHLGSLYESSKILWETLTPVHESGSLAPVLNQKTTEPELASSSLDDKLGKELAMSQSYCGLKQEIISLARENTVFAQIYQGPYFQISIGNVRIDNSVSPSVVQYSVQVEGLTPAADAYSHFQIAGNGGTMFDTYNPPGSYDSSDPTWIGRINPAQIDANGNFTITITVYNPVLNVEGYLGDSAQCTGHVNLATGEISETNCNAELITPTPSPTNNCVNPNAYSPSSCDRDDALSDINPNDVICSSPYPIKVQLVVDGYKVPLTQEQFMDIRETVSACIDHCHENHIGGGCDADCYWQPLSDYTSLMSRDIGVNLIQIPYLERIGVYTTRGEGNRPWGIFDIFRPSYLETYAYKEAKSDIGYSYQPTNSYSPKKQQTPHNDTGGWLSSNSDASPDSGDFYYPWLGGVEMAKQCVSKVFAQPDFSVDQVISSQYCPKFQNN